MHCRATDLAAGPSSARLPLYLFVLPTVVVAAAFNSLFEQTDSLFGQTVSQRSLLAILGAHVFFNVAIIIRVVGGFWQGMDGSLEEAARVLGAKPLAAFTRVTLPRLVPVILGASLLVFLFSFTSFGVILILGGPKRATIETEIYRYAISRGELDVAALLALVQLFIVIGLAAASAPLPKVIRQGLNKSIQAKAVAGEHHEAETSRWSRSHPASCRDRPAHCLSRWEITPGW